MCDYIIARGTYVLERRERIICPGERILCPGESGSSGLIIFGRPLAIAVKGLILK